MPTPVTDPDLLAQLNAPARADVQPSRRVWGDQEAQASGLYETPVPAGLKPVSDPALLQQLNGKPGVPQITVRPAAAVADRFEEPTQPWSGVQSNAQGMQVPLDQRAQEMTRGPRVAPAVSMAIEHGNLLASASQGTSPNVDAYRGRLVSADTHEDDGGNLLYRDQQTGQLVPTNNETQVAIRDPADNRIKVFSRSDATNESAPVGIARTLAPGLMAGAPTARPAIAATDNIVPKASDIFSTAKPLYRAFKNEAGKIEVPAETATGIAERMRGALERANFIPELAPQIYSAIGILEKGEGLTIDVLQNIKRVIGRGFNSPDKNVRDAAAVSSKEIGKIISEVAPEAAANLKKADAIHSTAKSVQELQRKEDIAGLRTGRAGYGGNAVNSMRQVLSPIVQRSIEGRTTGFHPGEITAMREIVEGTTGTNFLRGVGQLSPSKGAIPTLAGGIPSLGVLPAIGAGSNKLAAMMTGKQIEQLNELVAKRSPAYAKAVEKAVERFEKAQIEFGSDPSPARFAAYLSASRALSGGLTKDGIQITSGQLLRSIQGPMKSAAEGDEPAVPRGPSQ